MRRLLSIALIVLASPALAEETIADQAKRAYDIFAGGLSQQDFLAAHVGDRTFANIAGNWVRLNGPAPKTGIETYGTDTERFCKSPAAITLGSPNPLVLTVSTNLNGPNFSQQYTLIAGTTFGEHTDPVSYLDAVGLGPDKTGDQADAQRALLLSLTNGTVQIYRPSEDVLVIARERGYPIVLVRCPSPPPPDTSASEAPPSASSSEAK